MRVFITGASGYVGSAVVPELIGAGHTVIGLTRSDEGGEALKTLGAEVARGTLDDLDSLRAAAASAEGVIHLAFGHRTDFAEALADDLRVVEALGTALAGTGKPFITTAHRNGAASDNLVLGLAGVRAVVVALSLSVHDGGDKHGFIPRLINIARTTGQSAYVGDGANRWTGVHRLDAARLYRLALENAPAGSRLDGVGDEGVPFRDIAAVISRRLNVPLVSIPGEAAAAHFGSFLGMVAGADIPRSSARTQALLGWRPEHPGLLEDLEQVYLRY